MAPPHRVLILGDYAHGDFEPAVRWLESCAAVTCVKEPPAVWESAAAAAELCLFAQARPGRFLQSDVEALHRAVPLARLAVLLGAWCEGETRTDTPLAGLTRIYWHEWASKLTAFWDAASQGDAAAWRLPRTAAAAERTLTAAVFSPTTRRDLIAIRARGGVSFDALASACRAAGYNAVWLDPKALARAPAPVALIWEGDVNQPGELEELSWLAAAVRPAPAIALLNFPRRAEIRQALEAGAAEAIAKPFLLSHLLGRISRLVEKQSMLRDELDPRR